MKKSLITTTATILTSAMIIISATPITSFAAINTSTNQKTRTNVATAATAVQTPGTTTQASIGITKEQALQIALDDAGYKKTDVTLPKVKKDIDDGMEIWEVEGHGGRREDSYDIAVSDGQIMDFDLDD